MRRIAKWVAWLFLAGCVGWMVFYFAAAADVVKHADARTGAKAVLTGQVEAWNRGDLDGFMAGYWNVPELTFYSGGTVTQGWQPTLDRYRKRYQSEGKEMGTLTFDDLNIEALGWRQAIARGRWKVVTSKDTLEGLFTLLMRKIDGKWVIVHDHTSAADPPKPNP